MEQLYIAEKPSVAKALADYFTRHGTSMESEEGHYISGEKDIVVTYLAGHMLTLFEPEDYDPDWKSWWKTPLPIIPKVFKNKPYKDKERQYKHVRMLAESAEVIINAGDPDREGQVLGDEVTIGLTEGKKHLRLLLNALDDESIKRALSSMKEDESFHGLYNAGVARGEIDWLIGMNLTRYYTLAARDGGYTNTMSVGRVKTPTLNMVVERENEIKNFVPQKYFSITATLNIGGDTVKATLDRKDRITSEGEADTIINTCSGKPFTVEEVANETKTETVNQLYSLDTLQIDADRIYGISAKDTLAAVQSLYEKKYTTYPRSDCKYLPESQRKDGPEIAQLLNKKVSVEMGLIPEQPNNDNLNTSKVFNDKKISAHHAIIPTRNVPDLDSLSDTEHKIYMLIVRKYAGIFMPPYTYTMTRVRGKIAGTPFIFKAKEIKNEGYTIFEPDTGKKKKDFTLRAPLTSGKQIQVDKVDKEEKETEPPERYTEGTLLKDMQNKRTGKEDLDKVLNDVKGIGTPATRSNILDMLINTDKYLSKKGKTLYPTQKGIDIIKILPDILKKPDYTAQMEIQLSKIENGTMESDQLIGSVGDFLKEIVSKKTEIQNPKLKCPRCGGTMKHRKFKDKFTGDPKDMFVCDGCHTWFNSNGKGEPEIKQCPECHKGFMVEKHGKNGSFYGCTNYPKCKKTMDEKDYKKLKALKL